MGRKAARGSRGEAVVVSGGGEGRNRPSRGRSHGSPTTPSRLREGSNDGAAVGARDANPLMPGLRIREDGWTAARTRVFLATLTQTGCVADAARIAGVSTTSVNRSRALFPPFDAACAEALAKALRGLEAVAYQRAVEGRETIIYRGGKEFERRVTPSDNLLRLLIKRGDLSGALGRVMTPEQAAAFVLPEAVRHRFIDRAEFESGIVFDDGVKQQRHIATQQEVDAILIRRINLVRRRRAMRRNEPERPRCPACGGPAPPTETELDEAWAAEAPLRAGLPAPAGDDAG